MSDFDSRARKAADAVRQQIAENTPHPEKGIRRAQRSPARVAIPSAVAAAESSSLLSWSRYLAAATTEHRRVGMARRSRWQVR